MRRPLRRRREAELAQRSLDPAPTAWFAATRRAGVGTRIAHTALWVGVACGPAALVAGLMTAGPDAPATRPEHSGDAPAVLGPTGWAERALGAYIDGDAEAVRAAFPSAAEGDLPEEAAPVAGLRTSTVAAQELGDGTWAVTVAASTPRTDPQTPPARYFRLGVVPSGQGWVAAELPSEVAVPGPGKGPDLDYASRPLAQGALTETVEQWGRAYLGGAGELDRYLRPGLDQDPLAPTPYTAVELSAVHAANDDDELAGAPPKDGRVVHVLARIEATDTAERSWPLTYALELTGRSGRWEVSALAAAPRRAEAGSTQSTTPSAGPSSPAPSESASPGS